MTAGTLSLHLGFDVERVSSRRAYSTDRTSGNVRRREITPDREVRRWVVRKSPATAGHIYQVRTLWSDARAVLDIDWTPPDESACRVRFVREPRFTHLGHVLKSVEFELEEVL